MTKNASQGNFYRDCPVKPDNERKRELGGWQNILAYLLPPIGATAPPPGLAPVAVATAATATGP